MKIEIPAHPMEGGPVVVVAKFSGGRSSAVACREAFEAGAVDHVVFCNTGLESSQTYDFLRAVDEQWLDGQLVMLERGDMAEGVPPAVIMDVDDLDREGGPMKEVCEPRLPSVARRTCTAHLKVRPTHMFLNAVHDYRTTKYVTIVGFRADEPRRLDRMRARNEFYRDRERNGWTYLKWTDEVLAPLADEGWDRARVLEEFRRRPIKGLAFDPADPAVRLSNCVGCFLMGDAELDRVAREEPHYAAFWESLERGRHERLKAAGKALPAPRWRARALKDAGEAPADEFERVGPAFRELPWSARRRAALRREIPIQPVMLGLGGCGDGECGVDL